LAPTLDRQPIVGPAVAIERKMTALVSNIGRDR
jgi:hypothetical protein